MAIDVFKVDENLNLSMDEEIAAALPLFQDIMTLVYNKGAGDSDGRKRVKGNKIVKYAILMYKWSSPYVEQYATEESRHDPIVKVLDIDFKFDDKAVSFISWYKDYQENIKALQALDASRALIDKMVQHIKNIDFDKTNPRGDLMYNPLQYSAIGKKIKEALKDLQESEKEVMDSLKEVSNIKGDKKKSMFEDPS